MSYEFSIEYSDVIKAYQNKINDLMNQLITAEAKIIASEKVMEKLSQRVEELEKQPKTKRTSKSNDSVIDYNN